MPEIGNVPHSVLQLHQQGLVVKNIPRSFHLLPLGINGLDFGLGFHVNLKFLLLRKLKLMVAINYLEMVGAIVCAQLVGLVDIQILFVNVHMESPN